MKEHLDWALKLGSFSSKVCAIGLATVGIARLWSPSARQIHSLPARIAYSSAYLLHVGSTSLAASSFLGADPIVTPQVATALMAATSLLTNFVSVLDTQVSHAKVAEEYRELEDKLNINQQVLEQKIALLEASKDYHAQIDVLKEEIAELEALLTEIASVRRQPAVARKAKLTDVHQRLSEAFSAKTKRNEIIKRFFTQKTNPIDIDGILKDLLASPSEDSAILTVQCIRYKKIAATLEKLKMQLIQLDKQAAVHVRQIKPILTKRINALEKSLAVLINPEPLQIPSFDAWSSQTLRMQLKTLKKQIEIKRENADQIQLCLDLLFNNRAESLQKKYSKALITVHRNLKVETFKKQIVKTNVNFCSITTLLAVSLCLVPEDNTNYMIKMLMIGFGFLGSTSSFVNFCKKFMLEMDQNEQMGRRIKKIEKELEFNIISRLQADPEFAQKGRPHRAAKEKAVTRMYDLRKDKRRISEPMEVAKRKTALITR